MCGIAGYINWNLADRGLSEKMNSVIRHRGPDDEGYLFYTNKGELIHAYGNDSIEEIRKKEKYVSVKNCNLDEAFLFMGHRRLSIIDLSEKGHQPMLSEDDSVAIVFNGEIYNYIEIRKELEKKGYSFCTESDTEVIIKSYMEWGKQCVLHFNGMWAFVIWDRNQNKLFCSRDRLGVKPFYYYLENNKFLFGSEIKQIIQDDTIPRVLDTEVMAANIIYNIYQYNHKTLIQKIYSLPAGHNLLISVDIENKKFFDVKIEKYWDLVIEIKKDNEENIIEKLYKEIERSVKYRLRSDVKVGALLSGGLDSSSLVAVINQISRENGEKIDLDTFTSVYKNTIHDESDYAHIINEEFGCAEHFVEPDITNIEFELERLVWHMEGVTPGSILGFMKMLEETSKYGDKVIINGQNGDETLFGYERYYAFYFKDLIANGKLIKFVKEFNLASKNSKLKLADLVKYLLYFNVPFMRFFYCRKRAQVCVNREIFKQVNKKEIRTLLFPANLKELEYIEILHTQLPHILWMDDRGYMAFSMESRVPFVDYEFVELAMSIPPEMKINLGYTKYLLRKCMDNKMPQEVVWRKNKLGFQAPIEKWTQNITEEYFEGLLTESRLKNYFSEEKLRKCFHRNKSEKMLLNFIFLELFMRIFDVRIELPSNII